MAFSHVPGWVARPGSGRRRSGRWLAPAARLALLVLSGLQPAHAAEPDPARVLLVDAPPELERALRTALSPWGMQVDVLASASDAEGLAASPARASELARAHSAVALVWLDDTGEQRELRLFHAAKATTTHRDVPRGAIDPALAAALALSIKTQLRDSSDDAARAEAPAESAAAPPAPAPIPAPAQARDVLHTEPSAPHAPRWQFVLLAGVRGGALEPDATELRFGAELRWAPELGAATDFAAPWVGARFDAGPAADIDSAVFRGSYSELGGSLALGLSRRLNHLFSSGLQVSLAFHAASLEGTLLPDAPLAPETRWGSSLQLRPEMGLSLGAIGFVVQPVLGAALRRQNFVTNEQQLLETRPVWWMIGVGASVGVE